MTGTQLFLVVALVWALLGVSAALVMGRRGHAPFAWLVLAMAFGPLALPLAVSALRHARPGVFARLSAGLPGEGSVDILVGIDGSREAEVALATATRLHAGRIGRLTLAAVVDLDVASAAGPSEEDRRARAALARAAASVRAQPETILLAGPPAEVLRKFAVEEGFELIAIGRRGHGAAHALLGSVATTLARGADMPVLIV